MTDKDIWLQKFRSRAEAIHKRNLDRFAKRMYARCTQWKQSLTVRSKKYGVSCSITLEELRELLYSEYGKQCKYCHKRLDMNTLVLDHIVPISKGGTSNIDNLQIICKTSNGIKGSLSEYQFLELLNWLDTLPEDMKKDITVRLARGVS
jgi:5-methylcytosine-specific restriction endonuclease McrA